MRVCFPGTAAAVRQLPRQCGRSCLRKAFSSSSHGAAVDGTRTDGFWASAPHEDGLLRVGDQAGTARRFGESEVAAFAALSLDANPLHLSAAAAAAGPFGRPVVHGMLTASLFSAVLGMRLPGRGTVYLQQQLRFVRPVFVGEEVHARIELLELQPKRARTLARFRTLAWTESDAHPCVDGEALVLLPARAAS